MAERYDEDSWNLPPGSEIAPGRRVIRRLGTGATDVYLASDTDQPEPVVAKLLRPDRVEDKDAIWRLTREVSMHQRLSHPSLVRCFGLELDGRYPQATFEFVDGVTLARRINRKGRLTPTNLLTYAIPLADSLAYLASMGVVHLDVKPGNILLGEPQRLIDLGLARDLAAAARIRRAFGTARYMAPEQCDPKGFPGAIGPHSDVWAFGITLYFALSGHRPFALPDLAQTKPRRRYPQLRETVPALPEDVPPKLANLVQSMLAAEPERRPTAATVREALATLRLV